MPRVKIVIWPTNENWFVFINGLTLSKTFFLKKANASARGRGNVFTIKSKLAK